MAAKKSPAKRPAPKKPARKAPAKKAAVKPAKKPARKTLSRKPAPKKAAPKKPAVKPAVVAKKPAPVKAVPKPPAAPAKPPAAPAKGKGTADKAKGAAKSGKTLEAFCPRCKAETMHVVSVMLGEKIRRVKCNVCSTEHNFHRSMQLRARVVKTEGVPPAKRRKEELRAHSVQRMFEEQMLGRDPGSAKAYHLKDKYYLEDIITHLLFGLGLVTKIKEDGKIEVLFKDGARILAHNRFAPPAPGKK